MTEAPSSRLRVAIVDDEALARSVLREYLTASADVDIVAECQNGFEAVKVVSELHPDLLFLDVQMPKLDGFEVLELVGRDVAVVLTTPKDKYALRAIDVHADRRSVRRNQGRTQRPAEIHDRARHGFALPRRIDRAER